MFWYTNERNHLCFQVVLRFRHHHRQDDDQRQQHRLNDSLAAVMLRWCCIQRNDDITSYTRNLLACTMQLLQQACVEFREDKFKTTFEVDDVNIVKQCLCGTVLRFALLRY